MTDADILFNAVYHGEGVTVAHATAEEIETLFGPVGRTNDMLELWSLIAIRSASTTEIHALGWRVLLANTWITSPVMAVNLTAGAVRTRSGNAYLLGVHDQPELDPELRAHLAYALRTWGFDDVHSGGKG